MKEELIKRKNSILVPVLAGSAVGAGTALLLAPKSGKELRKDLKRFAKKTEKQVAEVIDEGKDFYKEGRKVVARTLDAGKKMYEEGTERLDGLVHKKERSFVAPILVGGLIGAGIALLYAPKSGKAVRQDIKGIAADTSDKVGSIIEAGKDIYEKSTAKVMELGNKAYHEAEKKIARAA
jgi:gas vesicle protein